MKNESGIFPAGDRVLVLPDSLEEVTEGGIIMPEQVLERHQLAQTTGILIAVGPDAYTHNVVTTERLIDGQWKPVERQTRGYSAPFAKPGDRVTFARYGGLPLEGEDGKQYRIINDEDITARVSDDVSFTDIKSRKRLGIA